MNDKRDELPAGDELAIGDFWDAHDLAAYWEQTEPAELEFDPNARRRYLVAIDPELLLAIQKIARLRGIQTESLVNLWLQERLARSAA